MEDHKLKHALKLYEIDYQKGIESMFKLEHTKLAYQRFFISLVTAIGTISIGFLKFNFLDTKASYTIENLIGVLLIFSTLLGYILIRNLVSIRKQSVWYNNTIIHIRNKLIQGFNLTEEIRQRKEVPEKHINSADYITILLCSVINLVMLICGVALLFGQDNISSLGIGFIQAMTAISYMVMHILTVERVLHTKV